ncbi:MAG: hypothetical protein WCB27_02660 [Thermoguttaceae bacterium]
MTPSEKRYAILVKWPRCPACGSIHLKSYRTMKLGGESIMRYSRCTKCQVRIVITLQ